MLKPDEESDKATLETLVRYKMLSEEQRSLLSKCIPFPKDADRNHLLQSCVDILHLVEKGAMAASANMDKLRIMIDFSKEVDAHRQNFHSFWVQMAQLILLNLLLPLLTGLLGYIFGTRGGESQGTQ